MRSHPESSRETLGFPSSVHIPEWRVNLFAQTSLEIVPLMINEMRAKTGSSKLS